MQKPATEARDECIWCHVHFTSAFRAPRCPFFHLRIRHELDEQKKMNSISAAQAEKRRQFFIGELESRLDQFCDLATFHHPKNLACKPFKPDGDEGFVKHGSFNACIFVQFQPPGSERWVVRVPIPGMNPWVAESLSSEVATMK